MAAKTSEEMQDQLLQLIELVRQKRHHYQVVDQHASIFARSAESLQKEVAALSRQFNFYLKTDDTSDSFLFWMLLTDLSDWCERFSTNKLKSNDKDLLDQVHQVVIQAFNHFAAVKIPADNQDYHQTKRMLEESYWDVAFKGESEELRKCCQLYRIDQEQARYWLTQQDFMKRKFDESRYRRFMVEIRRHFQVPQPASMFDAGDGRYSQFGSQLDLLTQAPSESKRDEQPKLTKEELVARLKQWTPEHVSTYLRAYMASFAETCLDENKSFNCVKFEEKKNELIKEFWEPFFKFYYDEACPYFKVTVKADKKLVQDVQLDLFRDFVFGIILSKTAVVTKSGGIFSAVECLAGSEETISEDVHAPLMGKVEATPEPGAGKKIKKETSNWQTAAVVIVGLIIITAVIAAAMFGGPLAFVPGLIGLKVISGLSSIGVGLGLGYISASATAMAGIGYSLIFGVAALVGTALGSMVLLVHKMITSRKPAPASVVVQAAASAPISGGSESGIAKSMTPEGILPSSLAKSMRDAAGEATETAPKAAKKTPKKVQFDMGKVAEGLDQIEKGGITVGR